MTTIGPDETAWREELTAADCWHPRTDRVRGDLATTRFKQAARLHQARWRATRDMPMGTSPYDPATAGPNGPKLVGSRLEFDFGHSSKANLISPEARQAAERRLAQSEPGQMLNTQRLWCDLLSSMPLCFNLFGPLDADRSLAQRALNCWFPDVAGTVEQVRLEWSPGRGDAAFLGNRTAFDAAFDLAVDGGRGVVGIETKYHEHLKPEPQPRPERLDRYRQVSEASGRFADGAVQALTGSDLQQIWQDHLLALSMLQHVSGQWTRALYVLVYPAGNPSFADGARRYRDLLTDRSTFRAVTLEELLDSDALPDPIRLALRERYLW